MTAYRYDSGTGEFLGACALVANPRRPEEPALPAYATEQAPPEQQGYAAVWTGSAWELVEDHRGETWFDAVTREPVEISELGPVPEGLVETQPEPTLDERRDETLTAIANKRRAVEQGGITLADGTHIATAREDQAMINAALVYLRDNPETKIDWKAANGWVQIGLAELEAIKQAVGAHIQACFSAERAHVEAVEVMTAAAELDAYDIETGWPA